VIRDRAFQFYYPENIQPLTDKGARVIEISAWMKEAAGCRCIIPSVAVFLKHRHGSLLKIRLFEGPSGIRWKRVTHLCRVRRVHVSGESLTVGDHHYPWSRLPVVFGMEKRRRGMDTRFWRLTAENPFFLSEPVSRSRVSLLPDPLMENSGEELVFRVKRGRHRRQERRTLPEKYACHVHTLHALGTPEWAEGLVGRARQYRNGSRMSQKQCRQQ